jgi:hypothetical protein
MDMINGMLKEDLEYELLVEQRYVDAIRELPRGSMQKKRIYGNEYFYLKYREGSKVKTDYLGVLSDEQIEEIQGKISKRKQFENLLKEARKAIKYLRKVLNVKTG